MLKTKNKNKILKKIKLCVTTADCNEGVSRVKYYEFDLKKLYLIMGWIYNLHHIYAIYYLFLIVWETNPSLLLTNCTGF